MKHLLKLSHEYASILRYKIIFAPGFRLKPFVPLGVCVSLFTVSSQAWTTGILPNGSQPQSVLRSHQT